MEFYFGLITSSTTCFFYFYYLYYFYYFYYFYFYFYFGLITSSTTCFFCSGLTKPACFYIGSPLVAFQHLPTGYLLKFRALDKKQWALRAESHL